MNAAKMTTCRLFGHAGQKRIAVTIIYGCDRIFLADLIEGMTDTWIVGSPYGYTCDEVIRSISLCNEFPKNYVIDQTFC